MTPKNNLTLQLLRIIGTPFSPTVYANNISEDLERLYTFSWENRIELLFLRALEQQGLLRGFEERKSHLEKRSIITRQIAAHTSRLLQEARIAHVIFKTVKPFPATPNDTDVVCLGDEEEFQRGLQALRVAGYGLIQEAPMQILMYHPWGKGKVGSKKEGGTWYVDYYRGVAVDYYEYINKKEYSRYLREQDVEGQKTILLAAEPEIAIVLFHNVFPEKTCHLEQFYLFLYAIKSPNFDLDLFIRFTESNFLDRAVKANLTIFEILHREAFGFVPPIITILLNRWGRIPSISRKLIERNYHMQFIFSNKEFWRVFLSKQQDPYSRHSLLRQFRYMLTPRNFLEVLNSLWVRMVSENIYGHQ